MIDRLCSKKRQRNFKMIKLMNKTALTLIGAAIVLSSQVQADAVGLQVGIDAWTPDYEGEIALDSSSSSGTVIDFEDDLGFDDESHGVLWVKIEHPVPIIPNIKIVASDLDASASSTLTRDITYGDETFNANADIDTRFDMSNTEFTLYYELLDNWINLDAGLTLRQYDGQSTISTATTSASEDLDFLVPLLYLDARIDLPFTGFFVDSTLNTISVGDNSISDVSVSLGYESDFGLGARLGIRTLDLEFDEDDVEADLEFNGTYLNVFYHF
jgi:outer membrane protein